MRIIQRPKVCRGRHRLAAAAVPAAIPAAAAVPVPVPAAAAVSVSVSAPVPAPVPVRVPLPSPSPAPARLQQPSAVDQHRHPSPPADQQQPPSAVHQQPPSAADQHHRPSSPGHQQRPPSAARTPQPFSAAKQQQPPSAAQTPQPSSTATEQQPPSAAKPAQLPSAAKQQQPRFAGKQPQPLSEQHQPLSAGDQQSPTAAKKQQSPSTAESSQPQLPSHGDFHQQQSAAVKPQPLSAADQCQPPFPGEQQQQGVLESINNLRAFNHALTLFLSRFDALTDHLNRISTCIAAASRNPNQESTTVVAAPVSELETTVVASPVSKLETTVLASPVSELETSCRCWRALQKYVITHLSDVDGLRAQVPGALQRAPDPVRVVLDVIRCGGRYYLNPPWAYKGANNPKVAERRVCILILEFFLSGCFPAGRELITVQIKSAAGGIAAQWRERLIGQGGIAAAGAADALGLLLFLGSFGVLKKFSSEDLYDLLHLSKSEKEAHVLRRSPFLLEKMPGVINYMVSKDMHVEAVNIVLLFGLVEKFDPLSMLSCLLRKAKQASEEMRDELLSPISVKESNEKYLTVLESVAKCLEVHKLDSSGFDFNIKQMVMMLRTKNVEIVQKLKDRNIKRNAVEVGPSYARGTLPKRPRPSATELTCEITGI